MEVKKFMIDEYAQVVTTLVFTAVVVMIFSELAAAFFG